MTSPPLDVAVTKSPRRLESPQHTRKRGRHRLVLRVLLISTALFVTINTIQLMSHVVVHDASARSRMTAAFGGRQLPSSSSTVLRQVNNTATLLDPRVNLINTTTVSLYKEKHITSLHQKVEPTGTTATNLRKENSENNPIAGRDDTTPSTTRTRFPRWMTNYFAWHRETMKSLNETNYMEQRYLVARCLHEDNICGGASDRLQSLPALVMIANMTQRIFLIKWTRPAPLEEFLVPPVGGGLNWTVPTWLDAHFNYTDSPIVTGDNKRQIYKAKIDSMLVSAIFQSYHHGYYFFGENSPENETGYYDVYREMWHRVFEPSPPVALRIRQQLFALNLRPNQYLGAHVRAKYEFDKTRNTRLIYNALNCASHLSVHNNNNNDSGTDTQWPIYFASDSIRTTELALEYGRQKNATIVARNLTGQPEPLHLDVRMLCRTHRLCACVCLANVFLIFISSFNWTEYTERHGLLCPPTPTQEYDAGRRLL